MFEEVSYFNYHCKYFVVIQILYIIYYILRIYNIHTIKGAGDLLALNRPLKKIKLIKVIEIELLVYVC